MTKAEIRRKVEEWAKKHNLVLSLRTSSDYYINSVIRFGHCPCSKERFECPCPESLEDIEKTGHCLCRLFWKDAATYEEQMGKSKEPPDQSGSFL